MTLKSLLEKETVKFVDVGFMSDEDRLELKKKVKGMDKGDDEYEKIVTAFGKKVLKSNGFVKNSRYESVQIADTVDNIIARFEPAGEGYFGVAPMNEYDVLMIAGQTFMRVGGNGDQVYIELKK
jgi:hypothetical protein